MHRNSTIGHAPLTLCTPTPRTSSSTPSQHTQTNTQLSRSLLYHFALLFKCPQPVDDHLLRGAFRRYTGERLVVIAVAARAIHACAALIDACFRRRDQSCPSCRCALMLYFGIASLRSVREGEDRYTMLFCDSAVHPTAVLISLIY